MSKKMWNAESVVRRELQNRTQRREKVIERRKKKWKVNELNRKKVRRRKRRHLRNPDQPDTSRFKCRTFIQTSFQRHSSNFPNVIRICLLVQKLESIVENELRSLSVTSADGELHKRCFEKLYQLTFNAVKVSRTACHVIISCQLAARETWCTSASECICHTGRRVDIWFTVLPASSTPS